MYDQLIVFMQYILPKHCITRVYGFLAGIRQTAIKNYFIRKFIRKFHVDMQEAQHQDPSDYPDFHAFFSRHLREGVRTIDAQANSMASPVDGSVSEVGVVKEGQLIQAKNRYYSVYDLLGQDREAADRFSSAKFITLYLAPKDYHRVHMPYAGRLREMTYIPGQLFSVRPATVKYISNLFTRNERVVCLFETEHGPMAVIFVGAAIVGSIHTAWHGQVTPVPGRRVRHWEYPTETAPVFAKGDDIGHFTLGSTIIILSAEGGLDWEAALQPGTEVKLGQRLGVFSR